MYAIEELRELIGRETVALTERKGWFETSDISKEVFDIVDRIEKEYIKLPRDKDGDILGIGSYVELKEGRKYCRYIVEGVAMGGRIMVVDKDDPSGRTMRMTTDDLKLVSPYSIDAIKMDSRKHFTEYWCCTQWCTKCDSLIDGKKPRDFYGVTECDMAQRLDIVARMEKLLGVQQ